VHLESLAAHDIREQQLKEIKEIIEKAGLPAIIAGDFNFCSFWDYREMEQRLRNERGRENFDLHSPAAYKRIRVESGESKAWPPKATENSSAASILGDSFLDCYAALHGPTSLEDPAGFTFDTFCNHMLHKHKPERMRYDRIFASLPAATFELSSCSVEGKEPLASNKGGGGDGTPKKEPLVYLSDHFAVQATWKLL